MTDKFDIAAMIADRDAGTPSGWRVGPVDDTRVEARDGSLVAEIDGDYNQPETWPIMEANARRIARVPEMEAEILRLRAEVDAGLIREKDANARAMQHLRRAEKAEIASRNHVTFSYEWRERAEKAEAECDALEAKLAEATAPITPAEAAKVLLEAIPSPLFGELKRTLISEFHVDYVSLDEAGNEVNCVIGIPWTEVKEIIRAALRAIAERGQ